MNLTKPLALAFIVGAVTPAHALLQFAADINGAPFFCSDGMACDQDLNPGSILLANQTFNGVNFNGSLSTSTKIGQNIINSSSFSLINTNAIPVTITAAVGDTDFVPPVTQFTASGSGTFQNAVGGDIIMSFWNDPLNAQGANNSTDTPGTQLANSGVIPATTTTDSFAFNPPPGPIVDPDPFSMTIAAIINLPGSTTPGVAATSPQLINRGQTLIKEIVGVPEPETLLMLGTALGLLWFGNVMYRRKDHNVAAMS